MGAKNSRGSKPKKELRENLDYVSEQDYQDHVRDLCERVKQYEINTFGKLLDPKDELAKGQIIPPINEKKTEDLKSIENNFKETTKLSVDHNSNANRIKENQDSVGSADDGDDDAE